MKLQDLIEMFSDDDDRLIKLGIERDTKQMRINFRLEDPLK
jgi:hypothetical protein